MGLAQKVAALVWQSVTLLLIGCHGNVNVKEDGSHGEVSLHGGAEEPQTTTEAPLHCHHCYYSVQGDSCLNLDFPAISEQICEGKNKYCVVERYMRDEELITFTRGCSDKCRNGCESAGSTIKVEYCRSCCTDNYCNQGSSATSVLPRQAFYVLSALMAAAKFVHEYL